MYNFQMVERVEKMQLRWAFVVLVLTALILEFWYQFTGSLPETIHFSFQGISIPTISRLFDLIIWPSVTAVIIMYLFPVTSGWLQKAIYETPESKLQRKIFSNVVVGASAVLLISLGIALSQGQKSFSLFELFLHVSLGSFLMIGFTLGFGFVFISWIKQGSNLESLLPTVRESSVLLSTIFFGLFYGILAGILLGIGVLLSYSLGTSVCRLIKTITSATTYQHMWQWMNGSPC